MYDEVEVKSLLSKQMNRMVGEVQGKALWRMDVKEARLHDSGRARSGIPLRLASVCCAIKAGLGCGTVARRVLDDSRKLLL